MGLFDKLLKAGEGKKQRALASLVPDINALEPDIQALDDEQLRHKTVEFREQIDRALSDFDDPGVAGVTEDDAEPEPVAEDGESLDIHEQWLEERRRAERFRKRKMERLDEVLNDLLIEAFAVTREAAFRKLGQRHYDVQLMGGAALHFGWIAEMKTGEGKTLVSTLPVYLNGLGRQGVHVITVNEYLAERDANWMGQVHRWLGLDVGIVRSGQELPEKHIAYNADVTYGTNHEFGFDYLRDNMARVREQMVQRGHHFAIVDEVDSILIDEARTPLIISGPSAGSARMYYQFAGIVQKLRRDEDYEVDEEKRTVAPTEEGVARVEQSLKIENLYDLSAVSYVHQLNKALLAKELYHRDKEYIVSDGEVKIVDEFTGRILDGRRWSDGLHQAVEAKERVQINEENHTWATVTLQNYFRMYDKLSGMTGTAETEAGEFAATYKMPVVPIPTHRGVFREDESDLIYKSEMAKFNAIVDDVEERNIEGQPVLIGTASVEKSEVLSGLLGQRGIKHEVLNAKQHAREAEIVAQAGRVGGVTVATNMAGRGVDILLGGNGAGMARREVAARGIDISTDQGQALVTELTPQYEEKCKVEGQEIRELGGLYVIGSERHESRRIDNQLRGRSGRQGDTGESRFYLSLEDELMRLFATGAVTWVMDRALPDDVPIEAKIISRQIEKAQNTVEARNAEMRKNTLKYDEVMNEQRKVIYARRLQIIDGEELRARTLELLETAVGREVDRYTQDEEDDFDPEGLIRSIGQYFPTRVVPDEISGMGDADEIIEHIVADGVSYYETREADMPGGADTMRVLEREVMLEIIDTKWREHLAEMDYLREGIHLRGLGQQDPLVAWQREGFGLFGQLMEAIDNDFLTHIMQIEILTEDMPKPSVIGQDLSQASFSAADDPVLRPSAAAGLGEVAGAGTPEPEVAAQPLVLTDEQRVGRNDPCFCGSGRKFKNCHGAAQ